MITLFYLFGFLFFCYEFTKLITGGKQSREFIKKLKESETKEEKKELAKNIIALYIICIELPISLLYMLWALMGLFSSQKYLFLLITILSIVMLKLPRNTTIRRIDAFISLIVLYLIINSHFN